MKLSDAIAIAGLVLIWSVGYLHRKQLRQNEAYRVNPQVGLKAPPSPLYGFFKEHWNSILGYIIPIVGITLLMLDAKPITRWTILWIALYVAFFFFNLLIDIVNRMVTRILAILERLHS